MIDKIGHIKNPLTVIAIFAAIAEISGTCVLPFVEVGNQIIYIWFLMLFPFILIFLFFVTLNFNHKVLYAPSDYKNEDNFLRSLKPLSPSEKQEKLLDEVAEVAEIGEPNYGKDLKNPEKELSETEPLKKSKEPANSEFGSDYFAMVKNIELAEKLSINKISTSLGLKFSKDMKLVSEFSKDITFDAMALDGNTLHAVEVKYIRTKYMKVSVVHSIMRKANVLLSEAYKSGQKGVIIHVAFVVDNPSIDMLEMYNKLNNKFNELEGNFRVHLYSMSDLLNDSSYYD
ncbi:hypothetical protein [Kalamiella sp. sgz302252]|uniref:hypothetical protein n=1 Tax=Pantoea sp. sgz302252 TaxID=3341827 RepID=UPI0036D43AE6